MELKELLSVIGQYKNVHGEEFAIKRIGVFGSAAREAINEDSDIDIVIESDQPDLFLLARIQSDLSEVLERRVDIVRKRESMNALLKRRIERDAVYV